MINQKDGKIKEILRELAATFFSRESNRQSLITITDVEMHSWGSKAVILMTVLPVTKEQAAVEFAHRQLNDFRQYVKDNSRLGRIPFFDVQIDVGEKNRQKIDDLARNV